MKKYNFVCSALLSSLLVFSACTDLEVEALDSELTEEDGVFTGVNPTAQLTTGYVNLRDFANQENLYALMEVTSDEQLVPTRGTDWGDNGLWRTLHQHNWGATHPQILGAWNMLNSNVFRMNQLLFPGSNASAEQAAQAKFLRAYNMMFILDLFGKVPYREADEGIEIDPTVFEAQEAFDFIMRDLTEALPDLPNTGPGANTNRASKATANLLIAKMLLNKHIYLQGPQGTPEAADMTAVIENVEAITQAGFSLQQGYFDIFTQSTDSETMLSVDQEVGLKIWNGLHYNQRSPDNEGGGWNGFSTTAEFFDLFEGDPNINTPGSGQEERRGFVPTDGTDLGIGYGFLIGQQYGPEGNPLNDRAGNPLVFTRDFPALTGNNERTGIRIIKYHPVNGGFTRHQILLRYADAHLMKIEAMLRGGSGGGNALELYNELRTIRGASTAGAITLDDILDERGRELYTEGWRRSDQIRFGTYLNNWALKEASEDHRVLFPIPAQAMLSNPNLTQNPGY